MAGPAFQLFPPPPRPKQGHPNAKLRVRTSTSGPLSEAQMERIESAKDKASPVNLHKLVIKVNSVERSPSPVVVSPPPAAIVAPPAAYAPNALNIQAPPSHSHLITQPAEPASSSIPSVQVDTTGLADNSNPPLFSANENVQHQNFSSSTSPVPDRTMSPAFSTSATLVRANSTATHLRQTSPQEEAPMRSMFPVYDPTKQLEQQTYKPAQASPTHIPRAQISRLPYTPATYVPHSNVADSTPQSPPQKPFFTPAHLLDNLWVASNGQAAPAVQIYTLRMHRATISNPTITFGTTMASPFYSLTQSNLAGSHDVQSIMNEVVINRHHPSQERALPVAALDLMAPPSMDTATFNPLQQEPVSLLTSIFPKLAALQALDAAANSPAASHLALADPAATSPAAQRLAEDVLNGAAQRECCALTWSRDEPSQQSNPWASHMPSEGSYTLCHPTLGNFPIRIEGDCSVINKPSTRPVTAIYGHNMASAQPAPQKAASITILNPYVLSPTSPRANAFSSALSSQPPISGMHRDSHPVSVSPSLMSVTQLPTSADAFPDDVVLARLDFANDALTLNVAALIRFGNPFLVDVAASAILAVAIAEAVRGRGSSRKASLENFQPPPPSFALHRKKDSDATAFKDAFADGFNSFGGSRNKSAKNTADTLRKWGSTLKSGSATTSRSDSFDKDIELGEWYGQGKTKETKTTAKGKKEQKGKRQADDGKLPFIARGVIAMLTFVFKATVFVLKIAIKVVAGVVVMITRNFSRL